MDEKFEHGYALIIGVDESMIPRLELPVVSKDVQALHDVLVHPQRCGYLPENVRLLKGKLATRDNIFDSLHWLQDKASDDENATVIIYYSGHGTADRKTGYSYLIPYDISGVPNIRQDAIRTELFGFEISLIGAKRTLVVTDANGVDMFELNKLISASNDRKMLLSRQDIETSSSHVLGTGTGQAILCSSDGEHSTYVRKDGVMSIFTYHLIEALTGHATFSNNDNSILVTDVMSWLAREVPKTAESDGHIQIPSMSTTGVFPIANFFGTEGKLIDPAESILPEFQTQVRDYLEVYFRENPPVTNIYHGDHIIQHSTISSSDTYNMSGDFSGAMLNVKSTLDNVQQTIGSMKTANGSDKKTLQDLVKQLEPALARVPDSHGEDAETVSQAMEVFVDMAIADNPNKKMLQITGEGLVQAAKDLEELAPDVFRITTDIVTTIGKITGM